MCFFHEQITVSTQLCMENSAEVYLGRAEPGLSIHSTKWSQPKALQVPKTCHVFILERAVPHPAESVLAAPRTTWDPHSPSTAHKPHQDWVEDNYVAILYLNKVTFQGRKLVPTFLLFNFNLSWTRNKSPFICSLCGFFKGVLRLSSIQLKTDPGSSL